MAAEHFRRLAVQRGIDVRASSAGIDPDAEIPPKVVEGLLEDGIDVRGRHPRQPTREELAHAWRVVSFGCNLGDIAPPGLPIERWDDVPAVSENFKAARDVILARLERLLAGLDQPRNFTST